MSNEKMSEENKLTDVVPPEHLRAVGLHLANQIGFAPPNPEEEDKRVWFRAGQQSIATTLIRWANEEHAEPDSDESDGSAGVAAGNSE